MIGVGSRVKMGGMGRNEIAPYPTIPGVRVIALCDVDSANLGPAVEDLRKNNEPVTAYADVRKLLENKDIDAVVVTTPNHWHALVTIWACQAGKDVYVQKPASYSIFEGRQMVNAAGSTIVSFKARTARASGGCRSRGLCPPWQPRQGPRDSRLAFWTARQHRQCQRSAAAPSHGRLRSLVRSGPP